MHNNVKDFGACGDGISDDRAAIQTAIDEAVAHHKAGIWFPPGTYRVSRATGPGDRWSLDLKGVHDFTVMGEGPKSVVKLTDDSPPGNWHVFVLRNDCRRIVFKDLVIDGNRTGLTSPDEQSQGIEVESGTEDLVVDNCILRECFGDGMRIVGAPGKHVKRLRIENSLFQSNKRSGLAIQRALEQAIIANCIFDNTITDQSIDFEPSGNDAPTDLVIEGCVIRHTNKTPAVTLSGKEAKVNDDKTIAEAQPLVRCKFSNNVVIGGHIYCTDVYHLTVQNNTVWVTNLGTLQRIPIEVAGGGDSVLITGNLLVNDDSNTRSVISLDTLSLDLTELMLPPKRREVKYALIANNLCYARTGIGIQILSSNEVTIQGNLIVATNKCGKGILVRSETVDMNNISVHNNDITAQGEGEWEYGMIISAEPQPIGELSVIGNSISGTGKGIRFEYDNFTQTPVCALNRMAAEVVEPLIGIHYLPFRSLITSGATSRGGGAVNSGTGRFIAGLDDPEERVPGNVGDIFQRLNGSVKHTLYVKEEGNNTKTGWKAK